MALKAFYFAAEALHFTRAAELAGLTQSGVSQYIARLESELGVDLFLRTGRRVSLTAAGVELKAFAETYLDQVERLLETMGGEGQELQGKVRYAMPASCLMTPHFPQLLDARQKFPGVDLQVHICHSEDVTELLLNGEIDFGFVTRASQAKDVEHVEFAREEYVLVGAGPGGEERVKGSELLDEPFVMYPGMDALFEIWHGETFAQKTIPALRDLKCAGAINDLAAAITMVTHGLGLAVFPRHCVQGLIDKKKLTVYRGSRAVGSYPIYLIRMKGARSTARVERVIEAFFRMKN